MLNEVNYHHLGWDPMYMIWHANDRSQILYFYSTGGSIVFSDRIYPIQKGALCFIASQCFHYTMPDAPDSYERSKFCFSDNLLSVATQAASGSTADTLFSSHSAVYALIPEELQQEVEKIYLDAGNVERFGNHGELYFTASLLRLITYLELYALESLPAPTDFTAMTLSYINEHISEHISIDDLCQQIHMSKYHFCRRFKKTIGLTVMDYILQTRLTLAKNMLVRKEVPITQISAECGFSSVSYFCRVFKEDTGMTPQRYRKAAQ